MFKTCGYYEGKIYRTGVPLHQRKRDKSFYIVEDGKRISVAIVDAHGTVIKLSDASPRSQQQQHTPDHQGSVTQGVKWTVPYHGVQHTNTDKYGRRCSVQDNKQWAELCMWSEGCGFNPKKSTHDTVAQARKAGEKWLASYLKLE